MAPPAGAAKGLFCAKLRGFSTRFNPVPLPVPLHSVGTRRPASGRPSLMFRRGQRVQQFCARRRLGIQCEDRAAFAAFTAYQRRQALKRGDGSGIEVQLAPAMTARVSDGASHDRPPVFRCCSQIVFKFVGFFKSGFLVTQRRRMALDAAMRHDFRSGRSNPS
jgi:hypothetical protein